MILYNSNSCRRGIEGETGQHHRCRERIVLTNANAAEMKKKKDQYSDDGPSGDEHESEGRYADNRAYPEALHGEIVDVCTALDRWPEEALEAALAANGRIREAKRLHGAGLERKPQSVSSEKSGRYFERRPRTARNIWSKDFAFPSLTTAASAFSAATR